MRRHYEQELADTSTTDHDGTILEATDPARRRPDLLPWRHVIVDEYQDVNPAQAAFVHALTTPKGPGPGGEGAILIGVGDDWQAIFEFQGGDASLIRTTADPARVVRTPHPIRRPFRARGIGLATTPAIPPGIGDRL